MSLNNKSIAIFDISSGSVGGSIVSFPNSKDKKPEIIFSIRNKIELPERAEFQKFLDEILKTLDKTAMQVHEHGEVVLNNIYCFFTSPWATLHRNELEYEAREEFIVDEKLIQKLIDQGNYPSTDSDPQFFEHSDMVTIERNIVSFELNGYKTEKYLSQKAKSISINVVDFLMSENIRKAFEETIENIFLRTPQIKSSMFALNLATEALHPEIDDSVIIDIGSEITEIAVINGDKVNRLVSIPFGENNFWRKLPEKLNSNFAEARRLYGLYFQNMLDARSAEGVGKILESERAVFMDKLMDGFSTLSNSGNLPKNFFISANTEIQNWLSDSIPESDLHNFISGGKSPRIISLNLESIDDYINFKENESADSAMGLQILGILGELD